MGSRARSRRRPRRPLAGHSRPGLCEAVDGGALRERETLRKLLHVVAGLPLLVLRFLTWPSALALAAGLLLFNLALLPRLGGRSLWRERELRRGVASGVIAYPAVLVVAVLLFGPRLEWAAAAWALLAFGDGAAALVGTRIPGRALPWNPRKSLGGALAGALVGGVGCFLAVAWTAPGRFAASSVLVAGLAGALVAALLETLPGTLDDNWIAPLLGAATVALGLETPQAALTGVAWLGGSLVLAGMAWRRGWLSPDGGLAAGIVGGACGAGLGAAGWGLLGLFFAVGTAATTGGTQASGDRRGADQVLANGAVAALTALLAAATGSGALRVACAAALAEAAADTVSGEVGQRLAAPARLITTGRRVPAGTNGAVSWAGTVVGAGVAGLFALAAAGSGLVTPRQGLAVGVAGFVGSGLDSVLGATLERGGRLDNQAVNLISTATAALLAAWSITL